MKSIIIKLSIIFVLPITLLGQGVVALHSSNGVSMYSGVDPIISAFNNAIDGDTIYVPGGAYSFPTPIDKKVMMIGAGHHPDTSSATYQTAISNSFQLTKDATGSYFSGFIFNGQFGTVSNDTVNNLTIRRNYFNNGLYFNGSLVTPCTGVSISENIFYSGNILFNNLTSSLFSNNISNSKVSQTTSNTFTNNIFLYEPGVSSSNACFYIASNNIMSNNVFYTTSSNLISGSGNLWNNNSFGHTSPNLGGSPVTNNNYYGTDPNTVFVNHTGSSFEYFYDYNLQSPGTLIGNDGNEIGIYGGLFPVKAGWKPINPHIQLKSIAGQTDASGNLNIQIQVEAQND